MRWTQLQLFGFRARDPDIIAIVTLGIVADDASGQMARGRTNQFKVLSRNRHRSARLFVSPWRLLRSIGPGPRKAWSEAAVGAAIYGGNSRLSDARAESRRRVPICQSTARQWMIPTL